MPKKLKIAWLTGSCFYDVDRPLIPEIIKEFDICWIVMMQQNSFFSEEDVIRDFSRFEISGTVLCLDRLRSLSNISIFKRAIKIMLECNADLYYINYIGIPYLWPLISLSKIQRARVIYPCHDFKDHIGVSNRFYYQVTKKLIFNRFKNFQFFSQTQKRLFEERYKNKNTYYAPLALKDFGVPTRQHIKEKVEFMFFGSIRKNKGLDTFIKAANLLYEKYPNEFVASIHGGCKDWDYYKNLIKYPEAFILDIRHVPNEEIPDLFAGASFLVLPYLDVTQSGPLLISYNYELPAIASDLDGFKEYIEDGKTGFLFKPQDALSLSKAMEKAMDINKYDEIKTFLHQFIKENCSLESVIRRYVKGLKEITYHVDKLVSLK